MTLSAIIQFITALPKIIGFIKDLYKMITDLNQAIKDRKYSDALEELQKAKTEKEQRDAAKDYLSK